MKLKIILMISIILFCSSCSTKQNSIDDKIEIPFKLENYSIIIEATVNNRKGRFAFDTGTTESYLDINADTLSIAGTAMTDYEGERIILPYYHLNEITFGEHRIKTDSWVINCSDIITKMSKPYGYDGLLGTMIFEGYWCELSFSKSKIILHKKKPGYSWHNAQAKILFGKYNADFFIPVEIDDNTYWFDLDTGSSGGIYCPDTIILGKLPTEYYRAVSTDRDVSHFYLIKTDSVTILDETYRDKIVPANSVYSVRVDTSYKDLGVLGLEFMKYYDFLFDFTDLSKGKTSGLYFTPVCPVDERDYGRYAFIDNVPEFGIWHYGYANAGLTVYRVIEDSPAYKDFHLRPRMIITKINGEKITPSQAEQLVYTSFYLDVNDYSYITYERKDLSFIVSDVEQTIIVKTEDTAE